MFLSDTDTAEVYDIINTLKSNKSPGPLKFSNHFLKLLNSHISPLISSLINRSFDESLMPECLKIGKQTPVFKGGDNILSNYRPITVVNSIAKVFEKAVNARLTKYLDKFNLLTDNQFGFRAQHATSHAMIKLYDEALTGLDNKSCKTGSVLLDISKAFDCVDHEILLHKLQHYGIRGNVCKWFESFLTNRTHYVEINGIRSDSYTPDIGVPQGSVHGPMLLIIYVNDLPSSSSLFSFSVFADDTSLLLKSCRDVYHNTFITELNKVMDWFKLNKLLLNYKKSQYIFFGPHYTIQYKPEFLLQDLYEVCPHYLLLSEEYTDLEEQLADDSLQRAYVKGEPLLKDLYEVAPYYTTREHIVTNQGILIEQDEVKYLGIIFDNTLKFTTHINNITQKIGKVVGVLWKGRSLPLSIKLKIYYSLIYSQLNFAILVWGSIISKNINGSTEFEHVPKQLKNVNTVHNKAVRALVSARKRDPLSKIFRELRLLKLIDIYYYNLGIFAYQTFTSGCPHFFDNYAISHNKHARYVTRSTKNTVFDFTSDPIFYNQPHLQKTLQSIKSSAAALWNKLPLTLKQLINVTTFKSQLKAWLTKDYISSRETITTDIT